MNPLGLINDGYIELFYYSDATINRMQQFNIFAAVKKGLLKYD